MQEKARAGELHVVNGSSASEAQKQANKRRRWDQPSGEAAAPPPAKKKTSSSWDAAESAPTPSRWDETPGRPKGSETPGGTPSTRAWEATPGHATPGAATPGRDTPGRDTPGHQAQSSSRKNRWDETPKTERGRQIIFVKYCCLN